MIPDQHEGHYRKHPKLFQKLRSAFIWQREFGGRNIQNVQPFLEHLWGRRSIKIPGCSHD